METKVKKVLRRLNFKRESRSDWLPCIDSLTATTSLVPRQTAIEAGMGDENEIKATQWKRGSLCLWAWIGFIGL
jgi:hypothetical protein